MKKKKWLVLIIVLVLILAITGGCIFYYFQSRRDGDAGGFGGMGFGGKGQSGMNMMMDGVWAYGVTNIGISQISFEVENLSAGLEVEEIYVASGDEVEAGAKVLKLSETDVLEAREELEQVLREADLAYRAGAIEYEQSLITAAYDRDLAVVKGEQAKEVYEESLASLTTDLDRANESLSNAQEQIAEYHSYVDNDTYKTYFEVDKYQKLYDENLQLLQDKMAEWNIGWEQVTGGRASGDMSNLNNQYISVLSGLYKVLEQNLRDLEEVQEKYEDTLQNATLELQTLELSLPELKQAVLEAQEKYESESMQAKVTYETALNSAEYAQKNYETAISKAESDYALLEDAYEDAKENLELFESSVGDGYFYAKEGGNIQRVMLRTGQNLTSDSVVFIYTNPDEMTVTVSVDQSDISQVAVGDAAYVNGTYEGVVKEINPIASSDSYTDVTYEVTVELSGDLEGLSANETVTVILGAVMEEMQQGDTPEGMEGQMPEGVPEGMEGQMPEGVPEGMEGQMPEGVPEGMEGQMPEGVPEGMEGRMPEGFPEGMEGQRPEGRPEGMNGERPEGGGNRSMGGRNQEGGAANEEE